MLPVYQQRNYYKNNNTMADINKPKLQLRSGVSINGDKAPSPATKLLINHGKPNFTIQRSPKAQNGNANPLSPTHSPTPKTTTTSDEFIVKSTKFNGVFKPSNISATTKEVLKQNGSCTTNGSDNEAAKVVLRRTKVVQPELREGEDENVPEFILRQRRIQERLANQNILDFENRRSGYFTQVMISPTNPNRQSFVETMASPAIKPGLEMPSVAQEEEQNKEEVKHEVAESAVKSEETIVQAEPAAVNGQIEEEEVAKAIEEVNKAVEGEDDDKAEEEHVEPSQEQNEQAVEAAKENEVKAEEILQKETTEVEAVVETAAKVEETLQKETTEVQAVDETAVKAEEAPQKETTEVQAVAETAAEVVTAVVNSALEAAQEKQHHENSEIKKTTVEPKTNGVIEEHLQNGHSNGDATTNEITISHTNGLNEPSLPSPDPSGEKGVNFEPKTVISFSQELGNDVNKYPDTVKVVKEVKSNEVEGELKELSKLKFEIKADDKDIEVKPVLITETVTN